MDSSVSTFSSFEDTEFRTRVKFLLREIRELLTHDFLVVNTDHSIIFRLKGLIKKIYQLGNHYLNETEMLFLGHLQLFSDIFVDDMNNFANALMDLNIAEQQYNICRADLSQKHEDRIAMGKAIAALLCAKSSGTWSLTTEYNKGDNVDQKIVALNVSYGECFANIIEGHKTLADLEAKMDAEKIRYEEFRKRRNILLVSWQMLKRFLNI